MPRIKVGDIHLYCEIHGEGETLVLIPGFRAGLWMWFEQVEAFARRFRTIVFDPRGVGRSDKPDAPLTIKTMADDLAGLLSALDIERAHILGASFGGFVAQEFAIGHPQLTRGLILCCTSFGGPRHLHPSADILRAMTATEGLNAEERTRRNFLMAFSRKFMRERPDEMERVIDLRLRNPVTDQVHFAQLRDFATFDAAARVSQIKAPTLVMTGAADIIVPPGNSQNLAALIPGARLIRIEDGSHMFFIEQPAIFNRAVIEFLEEAESQKPTG